MKLFIIDWGKEANGGRFAIIKANSLRDAWWEADMVGSPFRIAPFRILLDREQRDAGLPGCYFELSQPDKPYVGKRIEGLFDWDPSDKDEILEQVLK